MINELISHKAGSDQSRFHPARLVVRAVCRILMHFVLVYVHKFTFKSTHIFSVMAVRSRD